MEIVETSCSARATRALAGATICLLAAGCATPVPADFCKALEPESVMPQHSYEVKQGAPLVYAKHELAQKVTGYAIFSNNAYAKSEKSMALQPGWGACTRAVEFSVRHGSQSALSSGMKGDRA